MTRTLWKNAMREIWNSKARFISIVAIIALGIGFFSGIKAVSPSMIKTAQQYYQENNLMDLRLISTIGFDDDDVDEIRKTKDVVQVDAGYMADVILKTGNGASVTRMYSLPQSGAEINNLIITQGRLPEKSGEIIIEQTEEFSVGDKIKLEDQAGDVKTEDILKHREFTIVGMANSPMFVSFDRGTTTIGTGSVYYFAYLLPQDFISERYTQLFLTTEYSQGGYTDRSDGYKQGIESIADELEALSAERIEIFEEDVLEPAKEELEQGIETYDEKKAEAEKLLADAGKKIEDGEKEYKEKMEEAQQQLDEAQKELEDGESMLPYAMTTYYEEILQAQKKISDGELQLTLGKMQLESAKTQYTALTTQAQQQLQTASAEYDAAYYEFYNVTKPEAETKISRYEDLMFTALTTIEALENQLNGSGGMISDFLQEKLNEAKILLEEYQLELQAGKEQLALGEQKLADAAKALEDGKLELETQKAEGQAKLDEAQKEIDSAQQLLDEGKLEFEQGKQLGREQLNEAQIQLSQGKLQLEDGKIKLEEGKVEGQKELEEGKTKLEKEKQKAEKELAKAKDELNKAKKQLNALSDPEWYVQTREDLPSYASFYDDTQRIDNIASVFPLFFLLVAVLVCLTTLTRLLEEHRTEIGVLKALGYSATSITLKYLVYAVFAGLLGCLIGVLWAVPTLPRIIYNAYQILYNIENFILVIPWQAIGISAIAALLCTGGVILFVCKKSLYLNPARLMRPKSPKPGKRIWLEYIPFIWNKMQFTSKVTARNIFRYKSRFLMTVIGVAGCTALIVAAMGLMDSINDISDKQFEEIFTYNAIVVPKDATDSFAVDKLNEDIQKESGVEHTLKLSATTVECKSEQGSKLESMLYVPQSAAEMKNIMHLHTRQKKEDVQLTDEGALISEKVAKVMEVEVGDTIAYTDNNKTYTMKITGIFENYINHYVIVTPKYYEEIYGTEPQMNMILESGEMNEEREDAFAQELLEREDVLAVSLVSHMVEQVVDNFDSMNIIVYVMIFCAGALAFVVLYNLTNINIEERKREIATIKVLGFYNNETAGYIYREITLLTVIGVAAGLLLGIVLSNFIIETAEIDMVMFGREIHALSFAIAAGLTLVFALIVNIVMYFKMQKISMVDSLKSIE